ncbi:MAG: LysM peptidoglycan-binding domain-containing protein [Spirochaetia bacterium]
MKKIGIITTVLLILIGLSAPAEVHIIQEGETLYSLSREYGLPVSVIQEHNSIQDPRGLSVGTRLEIPNIYIVQEGDTMYSIAREYSTDVQSLCNRNNIQVSSVIRPGQQLLIPRSSGVQEEVSEQRGVLNNSVTATSETNLRNTEELEDDVYLGPWPVDGPLYRITGKIEGIRIDSARGETVRSVHGGNVVWVGPYRGFGQVLFVQSPDETIYVYGGNEEILVEVGDAISAGDEIARIGINALENEAFCIFLTYRNGSPIDPGTVPRH